MTETRKLRFQANRSVRGAVQELGEDAHARRLEIRAWELADRGALGERDSQRLLQLIREDVRLLKRLSGAAH